MTSILNPKSATAFQLKGSIYTLTTLELHTTDEKRLKQQLSSIISKAPQFFQQTPVVLDLDTLEDHNTEPNLINIRHLLHTSGMLLVAIRGGLEKHKTAAAHANIAWLPHQKQNKQPSAQPNNVVMINQHEANIPVEKTKPAPLKAEAKIISRPVRSGQQVYSEGDLIVLGQVSAGAELLAGGHIHVYGPLRGRALAGVNGNKTARIFCNHFEAELVSISGQYKLTGKDQKNIECHRWSKNAQIFLDDNHLHINPLS
ncbi:septum site-determining protein MinC [Endozoicomonas sp. (ex Bugula neritina AB1)]|nr:septum site-determining protein MinC [Endozoicomonas sp. (ex Bugula neritina AB1)]